MMAPTLGQRLRWHSRQAWRRARRQILTPWWRRARRTRRLSGVTLELGRHVSPRCLESIIDGRYEQQEVACVGRHLKADDIVVELGAGLGFLSTYCALAIGSDRVFAFEANPALESHIRRTYALNDVSPKLEMCILGREDGEAEFFVEQDFWSSSSFRRSAAARRIRTPVKSVDDVLARLAASFLILDIEGGEAALLPHADLSPVRSLVIEWHPAILGVDRVDALRRHLETCGFERKERSGTVEYYERPDFDHHPDL